MYRVLATADENFAPYNFFEGTFRDDKYYGAAIVKYNDGQLIRGHFADGIIQGLANLKEKDGREFLMIFDKGVAGGRILQRDDKGATIEYEYRDDKLMGKSR